jgi:REP-associated tyrosine transposase
VSAAAVPGVTIACRYDAGRVPPVGVPYGGRMARPLRSDLPDGTYHVTGRGVGGAAIFLADHDWLLFLGLLRECTARHLWFCHAFCLMKNHYHVVLDATRANLSDGAQWLNGSYARRFNARYGRTGHLFGARFWASVIEGEDYLAAACRYVLANPVRAGLCHEPAAWRWSGSRYGSELD